MGVRHIVICRATCVEAVLQHIITYIYKWQTLDRTIAHRHVHTYCTYTDTYVQCAVNGGNDVLGERGSMYVNAHYIRTM